MLIKTGFAEEQLHTLPAAGLDTFSYAMSSPPMVST